MKYDPYHQLIIDALKGEKFETICEPGCGEGINLENIEKEYGVKGVGFDTDLSAIDVCKEKGLNCYFGDILEEQEGKYDIVFTFALFVMLAPEYTDRMIKTIKKMAKRVIFIEPHNDNYDEKGGILRAEDWSHDTGKRYSRNFKKLLEKYGFNNISMEQVPKEIWVGRSYKDYAYVIKADV